MVEKTKMPNGIVVDENIKRITDIRNKIIECIKNEQKPYDAQSKYVVLKFTEGLYDRKISKMNNKVVLIAKRQPNYCISMKNVVLNKPYVCKITYTHKNYVLVNVICEFKE